MQQPLKNWADDDETSHRELMILVALLLPFDRAGLAAEPERGPQKLIIDSDFHLIDDAAQVAIMAEIRLWS